MSFSWFLETYDVLESTQNLAKDKADAGAVEGLVIQALQQTGGYGRYGRPWVGFQGNIFLSFILKPHCNAQKAGELALLTGEVLADVMRRYVIEPEIVSVKLPNDVMLEGKKCAGILVESELSGDEVKWVAVGVGVNLRSAPEGPFSCLDDYRDSAVDLMEFRDDFLAELTEAYCRWKF